MNSPVYPYCSRTRAVALAITVAMAASLVPLQAATLRDFGHAEMLRNGVRPWGSQPLLLILVDFAGTPVLHTNNINFFSDWIFPVSATNDTANGYFLENSNGRFSWQRAAAVGPLSLPVGDRIEGWRERVVQAGLGEDQHLHEALWFSNVVAHTMINRLFDFSPYDSNRNAVVEDGELGILIVSNNGDYLGSARRTQRVKAGNSTVFVDMQAAEVNHRATFNLMVHETSHILNTRDIYGRLGKLSANLSLLGGTTNLGVYHMDPWHKMRLGWTDPRIGYLATGGVTTLRAVTLQDTNAALILCDPNRGVNEFFILEYRTNVNPPENQARYDRHTTGQGLVIWHVRQDANHNPVDYANAAFPGAERNWRQCNHCRALIGAAHAAKPCPSTNTTHSLPDDGQDRRLVRDVPSDPGDQNWRSCSKCGGLFYLPELAGSVCPAGGRHDGSGSGIYSLEQGVTDHFRESDWRRCWKCELLYFHPAQPTSACAAGGLHSPATAGYALIAVGNPTVMARGMPDLILGGSNIWTSGVITPPLRWYDGSDTRVRLFVRPFSVGDPSITVEWWHESETWVDFAYSGVEQGTFIRPWNTLAEGVTTIPHGGTLNIKTGRSTETARITKRMKMQAYGGPVILGR